MSFSDKQLEFLGSASHRWNIKTGATRSGKTYLDYFVIPKRLRSVSGRQGLKVILGNTQGTLQRNVIEPMQDMWGTQLVSNIRSDNTAWLFGEKVFCLGADKVNSVNRIRGASFAYVYCDEVATYHPDVFNMVKSRLDKSYSKCDATCNPESSTHWFKKFIDSNADLYVQKYTIDDNPFLDVNFVDNLKREYYGTVYYDRYILGNWVQAEGRVYKTFKHNKPNEFGNILDMVPENIYRVTFGIDFGGNKSATTFCAVGWYIKDKKPAIVILDEVYDTKNKSVESIIENWKAFYTKIKSQYPVDRAFADSAEQLIIKSLNNSRTMLIENAMKRSISDRIRLFDIMFSTNRAHIMRHCSVTIDAILNAVYNDKTLDDQRLDDGTSNIDSLDAMEYAVERDMSDLIRG